MYKIDHVAFPVKNMEQSLQFYRDILEIKVLSLNKDEKTGQQMAFLELQGGNLELIQPAGVSSKMVNLPHVDRWDLPHLALTSTDLTTTMAFIKAKAIPIVKGPIEIPNVVKLVYIADPDENIIEFLQWLKK